MSDRAPRARKSESESETARGIEGAREQESKSERAREQDSKGEGLVAQFQWYGIGCH